MERDGTLVVGRRRWLAAQRLKWATIPARMWEDLTPLERAKAQLVENAVRLNLTQEERVAAQALLDEELRLRLEAERKERERQWEEEARRRRKRMRVVIRTKKLAHVGQFRAKAALAGWGRRLPPCPGLSVGGEPHDGYGQVVESLHVLREAVGPITMLRHRGEVVGEGTGREAEDRPAGASASRVQDGPDTDAAAAPTHKPTKAVHRCPVGWASMGMMRFLLEALTDARSRRRRLRRYSGGGAVLRLGASLPWHAFHDVIPSTQTGYRHDGITSMAGGNRAECYGAIGGTHRGQEDGPGAESLGAVEASGYQPWALAGRGDGPHP